MLATLSITFPMIDPVLVSAGPFEVRWYSLSYVAGILLGVWYLTTLNKKEPIAFTKKALEDIILWIIIGILLGGRLGYVLFYNAGYYLEYPGEILSIWKGGMSFHGGLLGMILAMYLMCRRHKMAFWPAMDLVACATPIGLFLGRIANFINAELYGRVTDVPWGVVFPNDSFARHPSQLYEAALEGIVLFIILNIAAYYSKIRHFPGALSGLFLIGYGSFRAFIELFREPDEHIGFLFDYITMGQLLCVPMIAFGIYLVTRSRKHPITS